MKVLPVVSPAPVLNPLTDRSAGEIQKDSFREVFDRAMQNLNEKQLNSEQTIKNFLTGEVQDLHTVMIAMEEAKLTMQLAVEVRNKVIEAYQELARMQI
ncbi:flagellar hook-basal body complex protein FliE [Desulfallas thermosapovorans]|uniref:Flagellar hook-basal body complex protein FliE n=1 Tax=Desulfallas thermosapovorans DSM 6562 TaxID=1121431 RepID=A0A5S4ZS64_9FIRM|nr:flagellar hook-basal body complex protein FliE [Desulfallas thermosapovorans]TYO95488.1 flagellar hook-basal body complex protein FliE [Desulfallas thermosapovorans DSM 6562]